MTSRQLAAVSLSLGLLSLAAAGPALAVEPTGYLDGADCNAISGWSQDPDEPSIGIAVHLYLGGPAGSGAPAVGITANIYRGDLCGAIGSCEHGFSMAAPLSMFDNQPRAVHAYGIDSMGGPNPQLGNSPRTFQCAPSASGVRRKVTEVSAVDAWKFSQFWDVMPLPAADAGALPPGPDVPEAPQLITPDDGSGALWLVDSGLRRAVPPGAVGPWRFDPAKVEARPAAEIAAMTQGPDLRGRPVLVLFEGLSLIDDVLPEAPSATPTSSGAGGGGAGEAGSAGSGATGGEGGSGAGSAGSGGGSGGESAGCALGGGGDTGAWLLLGAVAAVSARRRRRIDAAAKRERPG
jgi:hypothetical protein